MKKHILLIDDDKDELALFLDALRGLEKADGFKCTYASNPKQALDMLKYLVPDFIFVDFNMPEMNGLELLSVIAREKRLNESKKFLYSVHIDEASRTVATFLNVSCMIKANTLNELTLCLQEIIYPPQLVEEPDLHQWE